ncbi:protein BONZAI 1-like isoform X2 [Nymphaea colorata]|uniref:protein BONZAI 1-like isoform X2 n=1 Tax=Nymphaea colorata TaxID=210225 RepID=UPI00129DE132|nr:protein BONZAI 1-like isoform X2 [Nymphaea colorata]
MQLSLSATNLRDRDVFSKSDPMGVVYAKRRDGKLEELGRTEVLLNSLDPVWVAKISVTYLFEVVQPLVFQVYDIDSDFHNVPVKTLKLEDQQFLGQATCVLSEIVTKSPRSFTVKLEPAEKGTDSKILGQLNIQAEECISSKTAVELILRCSNLENKDLLSKSDPFLLISKIAEGGASVPICKTEVKKNDLNPTWKPVILNLQQIGSKDNPLTIECYDFNSNGKHSLIGKMRKSLADLERLHNGHAGENFFLPSTDGHNKVLKGQMFVEKFHESVQHSFLDYIAGGCELNFMVAIDFTASNGNPRLPDSLHYIDHNGRLNAYQRAILEVGEVLQFYDTDKRFPAFGFGARPIDGPVSHCFNLSGSREHAEVDGIEGIMFSYESALRNVSLAGPTLFGPIINKAAQTATQSLTSDKQKYFVLLIITDGVITDLQETKDAIVKASDLPLSILIVGVGGADFKEMEILDADKGDRLESSSGRVATRDIVQFVPFRDVQSGEISIIQSLLAELPTQFLSYMRVRNILPLGVNGRN